MFELLQPAPPDAILGLTEAWKKDPNDKKINLGVGIYKDDEGRTPILPSVKTAEERILAAASSKAYMPINGTPEYGSIVQNMLLGKDHPVITEQRIATAHTPGGTGGLRVGADFLKKVRPDASIWVSKPTWANHKGIFSAAGIEIKEYTYYDPAGKNLNFDAMVEDLKNIPAGDIVLFHVCCHNPTGVDLTADQWAEVAQLSSDKGWLPFLDFAYQGFSSGVDEDREGLLAMVKACPELLVAASFSKNFGLYQDRTGSLSIIASNKEQTAAALSHMKLTIRVNYSNPAAHGGLIVSTIMSDEDLASQWQVELSEMRHRIASVRSQFVDKLAEKGVDQDFSFIKDQKGMFSFSGLSDEQVSFLRDNRSIYIVKGGRINVAGITSGNIDYLCDAIAEALK